MLKKISFTAIVCVHFLMQVSYAAAVPVLVSNDKFVHPFYVGVTGGYGSTTWNGLVPTKSKQSDAILLSTPKSVTEGGVVWGIFIGYEFIPYFALEANYTHFPNASVFFDPSSLISFNNDGMTQFNTSTESVALMAKFMVLIPNTSIRAFSSAGAAGVHRQDMFNDCWQLSPTFTVGFNYNFTERIMGEIGVNYTGGYGESELDPSQDYIPFLYSAFLRLAYRFG